MLQESTETLKENATREVDVRLSDSDNDVDDSISGQRTAEDIEVIVEDLTQAPASSSHVLCVEAAPDTAVIRESQAEGINLYLYMASALLELLLQIINTILHE